MLALLAGDGAVGAEPPRGAGARPVAGVAVSIILTRTHVRTLGTVCVDRAGSVAMTPGEPVLADAFAQPRMAPTRNIITSCNTQLSTVLTALCCSGGMYRLASSADHTALLSHKTSPCRVIPPTQDYNHNYHPPRYTFHHSHRHTLLYSPAHTSHRDTLPGTREMKYYIILFIDL